MDWVDALQRMGLNAGKLSVISKAFVFLLLPFIGQWLFWVGFVELYADWYCPPSLWKMTTVWTVLTTFGTSLLARS